MAGKTPQPPAHEARVLGPLLSHCPECQHRLWVGYHQHRKGRYPGREVGQ
jgi:hypothetical protein